MGDGLAGRTKLGHRRTISKFCPEKHDRETYRARRWYDAPEPELRASLLLLLRLHCWLVGIECGPTCRSCFAKFDAILAGSGLGVAQLFAGRTVETLGEQRVAAGSRWALGTDDEVDEFWRAIHRGRRHKPPSAREYAMIRARLILPTASRADAVQDLSPTS